MKFRWPIHLGCLGLVFLTVGCADSSQKMALPRTAGNFNPPRVISGHPDQDLRAFMAADEQLSDADWRLLEQFGPRVAWERLEGLRRTRAEVEGESDEPANDEASEQASAAAQPAARPPLDVDQLPVTIVPVDDTQVRMIWVLQSYGGSVVSSSRDNNNLRNVALKRADLGPLVAILTNQLKGHGTCEALPAENTLVVTCDKGMQDQVLQTLSLLDVTAPQVEITARIFEVSSDFDFQQGTELIIGHLASSGSQNLNSTFSAKRFLDAVTSGSTNPVQGSVMRIMQVFEDAGISLDVSFQLLAESGMIKVVSSPRLTVALGQTGYMLAGQELPIQSAKISNGNIQTSTTFKPVGVQLYITPLTASQRRVKLHVISIVSAIAGFAPLPTMDSSGYTDGLVNPIIDSREAETSVTVGHGDTLVISGLRMVRETTRENKIPWLGDVPGLEWMFKNHRSQQRITDLYFFITPRLVAPDSDSQPW